MLVASTPETTNPVSTQCEFEEVPCISTVARGSRGSSAGKRTRRRAARPGSLQVHLPLLLGAGGRHRRLHQHVGTSSTTNKSVGGLFPNDGDGNAWGDKLVGFPPVLAKLGYKLTDPGRYQNLTDNFTAQISAFKKAKLRHHHRRDDAARLHHVLDAGAAAGLQAEGRLRRQGAAVPGRGRSARRERQQPVLRNVVDAEPSLQVLAHRGERQSSSPAPTNGRPRSNGRSRSASCTRCSRSAIDLLKRTAKTWRRRCDGAVIADDQSQHDRRPHLLERARNCRPLR